MIELALVLMAAVTVAFTLWPFIAGPTIGSPVNSRTDTALGRMSGRKDVLLQNIADLDFEFHMGKLSEDDYQDLRHRYKLQAAEMYEQIDVLSDAVPVAAGSSAPAPTGTTSATAADAGPRFCISCGGALPTEARFCPGCGNQIQA